MSVLSRRSLLAALLAFAMLLLGVPAAHAADQLVYTGNAAATRAHIVGNLVTSGPTSYSSIHTPHMGVARDNTLARAEITGLLEVGALSTSTATAATLAGKRVTATTTIADVSLLGGIITAEAVKTTATGTTALLGGKAQFASDTELVNLRVAGQALPLKVKPNTKITIPGVAQVVLNESVTQYASDRTGQISGTAVKVTLLKEIAGGAIGSTIELGYANAGISTDGTAPGEPVGGHGYSTKASANVLGIAKVLSGPTALQVLHFGGTGGQDLSNSLLRVNLPGTLGYVAATNTTVNGIRSNETSRATVANHVADVNLLNGLIRAEAIYSQAEASKAAGGDTIVKTGKSDLIGLTIAGTRIPVNVPANTTIPVPGVGKVVLNSQVVTPTGITVVGALVVIDTSGLGVPVGARVELGVANAWVTEAG